MDPSQGSSSFSLDDVSFPAQLPETLTAPNMMETDSDHETLSRRLVELERVSNLHDKLLVGMVERDVVLVAGKILKWSVKKQSKEASDGRGYFPTIQCLEAGVRGCRLGISAWPEVERNYPDQVRIINRYEDFKRMLPGSFK